MGACHESTEKSESFALFFSKSSVISPGTARDLLSKSGRCVAKIVLAHLFSHSRLTSDVRKNSKDAIIYLNYLLTIIVFWQSQEGGAIG